MDLKQVSEIVAALCASRSVTELTVRTGPDRLTVRRALAIAGEPASVLPTEPVPPAVTTHAIRSPLVGVFHHLAGKHEPVAAGAPVQEGQALGAIESIGMLYEVAASEAGTVNEVLVVEGQPVEYGQDLFLIQPGSGGEQ